MRSLFLLSPPSAARRALRSAPLALALALGACGDSGGSVDTSDLSVPRTSAACPTPFSSCGGNPSGRWVVSTFCDFPPDKPACGTIRDYTHVDLKLFLNLDGSYTTTDAPGQVVSTTPASCYGPAPDGGTGLCETHAPTGATCATATSGDCVCTASEAMFPAGFFNFGGAGTWTIATPQNMDAGNKQLLSIAAAGGSPHEYDFCVKDGVLQWELAAGQVLEFVKQ